MACQHPNRTLFQLFLPPQKGAFWAQSRHLTALLVLPLLRGMDNAHYALLIAETHRKGPMHGPSNAWQDLTLNRRTALPSDEEKYRLTENVWLIEGVTKAKVWNLDFIGYFADSHLALVNGARWSPPPVPEKVEGASSPQATGAGSVVRAVLAPAATPPHPPVMPSPK